MALAKHECTNNDTALIALIINRIMIAITNMGGEWSAWRLLVFIFVIESYGVVKGSSRCKSRVIDRANIDAKKASVIIEIKPTVDGVVVEHSIGSIRIVPGDVDGDGTVVVEVVGERDARVTFCGTFQPIKDTAHDKCIGELRAIRLLDYPRPRDKEILKL